MKKVTSIVLLALVVTCFSWTETRNTFEGSGIRSNVQVNHYYVSHAKLPFGSKLLITNLSNGKQTYAYVGGRLSKKEKHMFSLSPLVADALGAPKKGSVKLRAELITKTQSDSTIGMAVNEQLMVKAE